MLGVPKHSGQHRDFGLQLEALADVRQHELGVIQDLGDFGRERSSFHPLRGIGRDREQRQKNDYMSTHTYSSSPRSSTEPRYSAHFCNPRRRSHSARQASPNCPITFSTTCRSSRPLTPTHARATLPTPRSTRRRPSLLTT